MSNELKGRKKTPRQIFPSKYLILSGAILFFAIGITIYYFSQNHCKEVPAHLAYPNAQLVSESYPSHRASRFELAYYEYETSDTRQEIVEFYLGNNFRCRDGQNNLDSTACDSPNTQNWYSYTVIIDDTTSNVSLSVDLYWYIDCQGYLYPW